ncbi:cytosine permease [uncultured Endozoicomonas sp.]|uniref:purine-cytosine permease family protein n=1 Tax=uncultured Endozoicomonas sp. TaxID=432652 RepID=UPI002627F82E|nr:cytosine permease [uncultured Endozoicomonas sp.]
MKSLNIKQVLSQEQLGLEPVPIVKQVGGLWPLFKIYSNFFINPGTLVTSGVMAMAGLSFFSVVGIHLLSTLLGMMPFLLLSLAGVKYGIPGQVVCRVVFGIRGSRWITSILRLLCSIYWFAFQTAAGSLAIEAILRNCFEIVIPLWSISLVFALFQGAVAVVGYDSLKWLSGVSFPAKLVIFAVLIGFVMAEGGAGASPSVVIHKDGLFWDWALALVWINTLISSFFTIMTDASDFTRYTRSAGALIVGSLSGALVGTVLASSFGVYAVIAGGLQSINPFETVTRLDPGVLILILMATVIFLDNWSINVINLYTGGLCLCNMFSGLGRPKATLIVAIVAALLTCIPELISGYVDHMAAIGTLFAPIAGALLAWYFLQFQRVDVQALYDEQGIYWYFHGFNRFTCLLIPISFIVGFFIPEGWLPGVFLMVLSLLLSMCHFHGQSQSKNP